ncbi:MAG: endonuclease, partial [Bacteroidales bacterium]|nr:endonuclease [Bacteroidales bacterium]
MNTVIKSHSIKTVLLFNLLFLSTLLFSQIPSGYYDDAIGKSDTALQIALHNIIKGHNGVGYGNVPNHHQTTDKKPNGKVWDMYSDIPGGTPPYQFTFITDKCGNYSQEGDCYNREHSFPQSWFGSNEPMQSDLFHVYPTDGYVNGKRSNWPFAEVDNPTWTSLNGSKLGPSVSAGYSGTGFEPIDEYKGDFARTYFYMAVRYYSEDNSWDNNSMVDGSQLKPWALQQLYLWHLQDTVSQKEINRNDAVYQIQGNRNPFIDRPDWVDSLWFPAPPPNGLKELQNFDFQIYPNPTSDALTLKFSAPVTAEIRIRDMQG